MRRGKKVIEIQQPIADPEKVRYVVPQGIPIEIPVPERELVQVPVRKEEKANDLHA